MKQFFAWLSSLFGGGKKKPPVVIIPPPPVQQPFKLNWPDRRPIGFLMLASYAEFTGTNNWRKPEGLTFNDWLQQEADRCLAIMKDLNAQGIIFWDLEGQRNYPYRGDPEHISEEMDALITRFKGYKTGLCIRPDECTYTEWEVFHTNRNQLETLKRKICYARKRWGCTIFYIDSNFYPDPIYGPHVTGVEIWEALAKEFPDCLLIPEHERPTFHLYSAPFKVAGTDEHIVSAEVKAEYPEAFMVLMPNGNPDLSNYKETVKAGNIPLFHAWWPAPENEVIKEAYK